MKLKKIASLMLAGIMAVSMLAGCKTATEPTEEPEVTPVTGAAAVVNAELDNNKELIEFSNDADLQNVLSNWFEKNVNKPSDMNSYQDKVTVSPEDGRGPMMQALMGVTGYKVGGFYYNIVNTNNSKTTAMEVYVLSGNLLTEENALMLVGQHLDTVNLPEDKNDGDKSYSYTGSIAAVNAKTKGETENVWVIGVTITQTPADK